MKRIWRTIAYLTMTLCANLAHLNPALAAADNALVPLTLTKLSVADARMKVDGKLNEAIWKQLPLYDRMQIIRPDTLNDAPMSTKVQLFYTERGLYVGVYSEQPADTLVTRLTARDDFVSRDGISVTIDPSGKGLYAYWFGVSLGGSLTDGTVQPERRFSNQWDGPWRGAASESPGGWTAEFFLPWSMMTMPEVEGVTRSLGFYISRSVSHRSERWGWPALPDSGSQFLSALQVLNVDNFKPREQFTFYPYASTTYNEIESEDDYKAGFDVFWRPSSNLQLTSTVNPDFGNVESDDVDVNLTSFETFFPEKRPFFLEGQEVFATSPRTRSRNGITPTTLVNTRRIGSAVIPHDIDGFKTTELEDNQPSELDGAIKVTGQQGKLRYGVLAAIEDDTKIEGTLNNAEVDVLQTGRTFGVARFLYETTAGGGRKGLGWISTLVDHDSMDAVAHGIDAHYLSDGGRWNVDGQMIYSDVADVTGGGGFVDINYTPSRGLKHTLSFDYFDEDVDINDFGFLRRNDAIAARYRFAQTVSDLTYARSRESSLFLSQEYNTEGRAVASGIFMKQRLDFNDNSSLVYDVNYFPSRWDDINSNGNGDFRIEPRREIAAFWNSDRAKPVQIEVGYRYREEEIGGHQDFLKFEINWRPSDKFYAGLELGYRHRTDWLIHDTGRDFTTFQAEYWEPEIKLDYFFTARQQFRISAQWVGIKAFERARWQVPYGSGSLISDTSTTADNRDFTISTLVFQARYRWELAPLSDLFVVYTRGSDLPSQTDDTFDDLLRGSWTDRAIDVFVVKLRYRLGS